MAEARVRAYAGVGSIGWEGMQYRRDIADIAARAGPGRSGGRPGPPRGPPMIPRYSLPEMAALFTDEARFEMWLEVELLATEGWAEVGEVPAEAAAAVPGPGPQGRRRLRGRRAGAREGHRPRRGRLRRRGPGAIGEPEGSLIHYGLTSSDVVDTALCATLTRAADLLSPPRRPGGGLKTRALELHGHAR
jgi:hypothetical protein